MPVCKKCSTRFPVWVLIDNKKRNLGKRKYCLNCSPFKQHNTAKIHLCNININNNIKECVCEKCNRLYVYNRQKGHRLRYCNSCKTNVAKNRLKQKAITYKGGECSICGYKKCAAALCFHHVDATKKDFDIAHSYHLGWDKIKKEIDKCIILCQNCHHEIHYTNVNNAIGGA